MPRYLRKDRRPPDSDPGDGDGGSNNDPSNFDAGSDDEEQKRQDRKIEEKRRSKFLVSSDRIRRARKNRSKSHMRCKVKNMIGELK